MRSVKGHLKRLLKNRTPTFEELTTLLCKIECVLNSRPLGPLHDDVESYQVLTPGHFLTGSNLTSIPQPSIVHLPENRLSRWQLMQQCFEKFWDQWSKDYLQSLQHRTKWRVEQMNLYVGKMILVRQPNLPASKWLLGRVVECFPGHDGRIRTVKIRTERSTYLRPITELVMLPIDLEQSIEDSDSTPQQHDQ